MSRDGAATVANLNASLQHDAESSAGWIYSHKVKTDSPAIMAFVLAMAGMIFLTTPWVNAHVTPSILNSVARFDATWYSHSMCSGSSVSSFLSNPSAVDS